MNEPANSLRGTHLRSMTGSAGTTAFFVDAAAVLGAWAGALVAENTALGFLWRDQFSGIWEIALSRHIVVPMAIVGLAPASFVVAAGWRIARQAATKGATGSRAATAALAVVFAGAAATLAIGISSGRHFVSLAARVPFVALAASAGALFGARIVPRVAAWVRWPATLALIGVAVAVASWLADDYVLPRLYPAFHAALFVSTLLGASLVAFAGRADVLSPGRLSDAAAVMMGATVVYCATTIGRAADVLARAANLRIVLVEHAPLLGTVVVVSTRMRSGETDAAAAATAPSVAPGEVARALDWTGRDWLLLTVDALRADHVSAYGYVRPTTPNIDAIARGGALFEAAYCPTPHTSYSVTSMMTGKYLRPLLELGMGQDSETWAQYLRQYGWRTAAFYPPAVFYIDENRFAPFEQAHLGFEYAKVEFADPALRERQVAEYLASAPADRPLFLWVHFFEPHEPYVMHPEHPFSGGSSRDLDAYDSEVATADDGVGRIVRLVRASRPGAVVVVTADHGEEFGDHGGRYHGTTVYEEQVRVPLVVEGKGVPAGARIATVVQTIDLLPTALSALGIPRPARLRGRDLGPVLTGPGGLEDAGFAFAETDDYAMVAEGPDRLVCERRVAACALYDAREDPLEHSDIAPNAEPRATALRGQLRATERDHGRYESAGGAAWPEALRRGLQGERDAALDVASLLDDADANIRRKAAEVSFALHAPVAAPAVKRAFERDEDDEVRRWSALALVRMGEPVPTLAESLLRDPRRDLRRAAALALAERADARGCDELAAWWSDVAPTAAHDDPAREPNRVSVDLAHAEEMLGATAEAHCRAAVPSLLRALADVRARPYVADTLGALRDERARSPLLALLAEEPYVTTRPHEARALLALGARDWVGDPNSVTEVTLMASQRSRVIALLSDPTAEVEVFAEGAPASGIETEGEVRTFDLPPGIVLKRNRPVRLTLHASRGGVTAVWLVAPPASTFSSDAGDLIDPP